MRAEPGLKFSFRHSATGTSTIKQLKHDKGLEILLLHQVLLSHGG